VSERSAVFLRGLNVGGHRVKMAHLRDLLSKAGFTRVETILASGNVVLDAGTDASEVETEARIEAALARGLGYEVPSFLRSLPDVAGALDGPFDASELEGPEYGHYVLFLKQAPDDAVQDVFRGMDSERDTFRFADREVHWLSRGRLSESPLFGGAFERETRGLLHTMRNANTLRRLVAKLRGSGG
jgi:uncharacterized protein (DUF1697 family)